MPAAAVTASDNNEAQWLSVAAAREAILGAVEPMQGHEAMARGAGFERVLARDVGAPFDVPAHANSAMDGYAVGAADLQPGGPTRLTVVGAAMAGGAFSGLASPGRTLAPGEVYDSNRYTLSCALRRLNVETVDLGEVRDQPAALEEALTEAAARAGAVITTGGVSVPVAVMVTFCQFVAFALRRLSCEDPLQPFEGLW